MGIYFGRHFFLCVCGKHDDVIDKLLEKSRDNRCGDYGNDGFSEKDAYSRSDKTRNVSIADVITSMTSQPRDYDSQLQGCIHMGSFANDASLDVILSKQQGISCIFAAMKQFPRDRNITQASCSSLAKMAAISEATCIHIVREKGLSVLMNVLRNNQNESDILLSTLGIIERISEIEEMQVELFEQSFHSEVLTTLSRHSDNPDVVSICLSILSNLIMAEETAKALMYIGGVHVVIGVVNPFPCNTLVLENACRCIGSFASHDDLGLDVANAGCIDIVINILEQIHDVTSSRDQKKSLAECALYALACLSKYDEISTQISKRDNISLVIISPMTHLCENEAIQEYGSWIIANLASHDSSKHCACTPEVVNRLVTNLKDFPENLNLHLEIFSSLNSILSSCESLREHFVVTRAAECVFTTMATFNESPEILETGCLILGNLSIQENLRTPLEEQGCSSAIIAAMLSADHNAHVHEYGCVTMINISANVFDNKLRVARAGGVGVVMRTLQNFLDDAIVALCALKVLGNLLEVDEACYRFLEEDGLSILTTQYRCHGDDLEMLAFICDLLVQTSPKLELSDPSLETMESMLAEIHGDHGNEPELSLSVCQFYEALSLHEIGFKKFVISRGMDRVQSIAATHPTHVEIHTSCCRTLASYYMHTRESRVNLEHVQLVRKALNTFPCDIDLLTACLGAITYMTEHSDSTRQHLLQEGVLQEMTSVMQHHHDVARLQVVGLMSVDNILNVAEAKAIDDVTDFTMLVLDIMTKHIDNSDIQLFCCKIITLLQNIEADHTSKDHLLIPLVDVLRRRRSTGEVKSSARKALQQILGDEKYEELLCMHDLNGDVETRCTPNI